MNAWIHKVGNKFVVVHESRIMAGYRQALPNSATSVKQAAAYARREGYTLVAGECPLPRMPAARPERAIADKAHLRTLMYGDGK
ncbi:hypothetical protein [Synechococcus phage Ssp-JY38]|nr:hypothetical protein [Synechococcus phage Yong-L2-223]